MEHSAQDLHFIASAFGRFAKIGKLPGGGFTRLGYTDTEDRMHAVFASYAKELGCSYIQDEAGNSYLVNDPSDGYCLIASHLDSVIEGGEYDGAAGVIAGLMCLRWARRDGLRVPLRVGAFRCEESSNFGLCTIGSGLITHESYKENIDSLKGKDGRTIAEVFREKGWSLHPKKISGIGEYLEMHIEQGKVLDETKTEVGIVGTIAGPKRYRMYLNGMADHSGATPMSMRNDALCAAAAIILEVERIGHREAAYNSVATVGVLNNAPNVMNVIPGEVTIGIDMRGIQKESLDRMERDLLRAVKSICQFRRIDYRKEKINDVSPIRMSPETEEGLVKAARELGLSFRRMPSGAGHDAMSFPPLCRTGMVFIPCRAGISHNKLEYTTIPSVADGTAVMYRYLKDRYGTR